MPNAATSPSSAARAADASPPSSPYLSAAPSSSSKSKPKVRFSSLKDFAAYRSNGAISDGYGSSGPVRSSTARHAGTKSPNARVAPLDKGKSRATRVEPLALPSSAAGDRTHRVIGGSSSGSSLPSPRPARSDGTRIEVVIPAATNGSKSAPSSKQQPQKASQSSDLTSMPSSNDPTASPAATQARPISSSYGAYAPEVVIPWKQTSRRLPPSSPSRGSDRNQTVERPDSVPHQGDSARDSSDLDNDDDSARDEGTEAATTSDARPSAALEAAARIMAGHLERHDNGSSAEDSEREQQGARRLRERRTKISYHIPRLDEDFSYDDPRFVRSAPSAMADKSAPQKKDGSTRYRFPVVIYPPELCKPRKVDRENLVPPPPLETAMVDPYFLRRDEQGNEVKVPRNIALRDVWSFHPAPGGEAMDLYPRPEPSAPRFEPLKPTLFGPSGKSGAATCTSNRTLTQSWSARLQRPVAPARLSRLFARTSYSEAPPLSQASTTASDDFPSSSQLSSSPRKQRPTKSLWPPDPRRQAQHELVELLRDEEREEEERLENYVRRNKLLARLEQQQALVETRRQRLRVTLSRPKKPPIPHFGSAAAVEATEASPVLSPLSPAPSEAQAGQKRAWSVISVASSREEQPSRNGEAGGEASEDAIASRPSLRRPPEPKKLRVADSSQTSEDRGASEPRVATQVSGPSLLAQGDDHQPVPGAAEVLIEGASADQGARRVAGVSSSDERPPQSSGDASLTAGIRGLSQWYNVRQPSEHPDRRMASSPTTSQSPSGGIKGLSQWYQAPRGEENTKQDDNKVSHPGSADNGTGSARVDDAASADGEEADELAGDSDAAGNDDGDEEMPDAGADDARSSISIDEPDEDPVPAIVVSTSTSYAPSSSSRSPSAEVLGTAGASIANESVPTGWQGVSQWYTHRSHELVRQSKVDSFFKPLPRSKAAEGEGAASHATEAAHSAAPTSLDEHASAAQAAEAGAGAPDLQANGSTSEHGEIAEATASDQPTIPEVSLPSPSAPPDALFLGSVSPDEESAEDPAHDAGSAERSSPLRRGGSTSSDEAAVAAQLHQPAGPMEPISTSIPAELPQPSQRPDSAEQNGDFGPAAPTAVERASRMADLETISIPSSPGLPLAPAAQAVLPASSLAAVVHADDTGSRSRSSSVPRRAVRPIAIAPSSSSSSSLSPPPDLPVLRAAAATASSTATNGAPVSGAVSPATGSGHGVVTAPAPPGRDQSTAAATVHQRASPPQVEASTSTLSAPVTPAVPPHPESGADAQEQEEEEEEEEEDELASSPPQSPPDEAADVEPYQIRELSNWFSAASSAAERTDPMGLQLQRRKEARQRRREQDRQRRREEEQERHRQRELARAAREEEEEGERQRQRQQQMGAIQSTSIQVGGKTIEVLDLTLDSD
ncbi:uncharacterized protein PSFLO_01665 [Pseudozyma flocculosa]|uniref:Uncharacterized protein n=1 Tax=Pseudozyma flocculosa TaxID=84751 RepID=A0A5C3EVB7_9BASI|nr:uncharacterized protein PSFLO_01665 [Pseudozyma flocculosa]